MRVLLISDDDQTLRVSRALLDGLNCEVLVARAGQRGMALIELERPNVVVLDNYLPDMDTDDVVAWAQRYAAPVILVIALGYTPLPAGSLAQVLISPVAPRQLAAALRPYADSDIAAGIDDYLAGGA